MTQSRVYFVIDMKSFFASVECVERGLDPMTTNLVVADESRTEKTICLAVSPALKALGVKNRCRLFEIPKNFEYIIAPPRMKKYIEYASNIYSIYLKYISKEDIHVYSIDESFIDVTTYLKLYDVTPKQFAKKLMGEIGKQLNIPCSCGIGTNLYLAKIALDITAKSAPDRIGVLDEEKFKKELWYHKPLSDFWGISTGTVNRLERLGIFDMHGIAVAKEDVLYRTFGVNAELLIDHSKGNEACLMSDIKNYKGKSKSLSSSQILPCNYDTHNAKIVLKEMLQNGCYDMFNRKCVTQHLYIYIGYGDGDKSMMKGGVRMTSITNLYSVIGEYADKLFDEIVDPDRAIRRVGYDFAGVMPDSDECYDFFTDRKKIVKEKNIMSSVLDVKQKFGKNAILKGIDLTEKATIRERNLVIGGHKSGEE